MFDKQTAAEIEKARQAWEAGLPPQQGEVATATGIPIKPVYGPTDLREPDYLEKVGFPGEYPFVRGRKPLMYRQDPWIVGEYAGFADSQATNEYIRYLAQEGCVEGLYVALDLP